MLDSEVGLKIHYTTSSEVFETTRAMKENIFKTAFENVGWKFVDQTWVGHTCEPQTDEYESDL